MRNDLFFVIFIGAGGINFGSPEGPWNHSERLEKVLNSRLKVIALIDPDINLAKKRVREKCSNRKKTIRDSWKDTKCFETVSDAVRYGIDEKLEIHLIINGAPPHVRGTSIQGKDLDIQIINSFPQARSMFIEKPISASDPTKVNCDSVINSFEKFNGIVGVGYVLRYLDVVQTLKQILEKHKIVPMCINARYIMAYEFTTKLHWWNMDISCGPIVEQATHFVDLIRYLANSSINLNTIVAKIVTHESPAGKLNKLGLNEEILIPSSKRVPRITVSSWSHESGTISNLIHGVALHGQDYSTEIDIIADGWLIRLSDLYKPKPKLSILKDGSKEYFTICKEDDPFFTELDTIVSSVDSGKSKMLSSYEDALETYKLTWNIRKAGEKSQRVSHL